MSFTKENLAEEIKKYEWYHIIDLGNGIKTPGYVNLEYQQATVNNAMAKVDFKGKRVLDIGCRDGMYSFDAERRGAAEVMGIDNMVSKGAQELLIPHFNSIVKMHEINLYDLSPKEHGLFDVIIFPGVLYHLRYPFTALKTIRELLKPDGVIIVETAVLRSFGFSKLEKLALLYCPIEDESPYEATSVTFFNTKGMVDSLKSLGYTSNSISYMYDEAAKNGLPFAKKFKLFLTKIVKGFIIDRITLVCSASKFSDEGVVKYWNDVYTPDEIIDLKNPDNR